MGWIMLFLFIPGLASILFGAAFVGVRSSTVDGVSLDPGGPVGGAGW